MSASKARSSRKITIGALLVAAAALSVAGAAIYFGQVRIRQVEAVAQTATNEAAYAQRESEILRDVFLFSESDRRDGEPRGRDLLRWSAERTRAHSTAPAIDRARRLATLAELMRSFDANTADALAHEATQLAQQGEQGILGRSIAAEARAKSDQVPAVPLYTQALKHLTPAWGSNDPRVLELRMQQLAASPSADSDSLIEEIIMGFHTNPAYLLRAEHARSHLLAGRILQDTQHSKAGTDHVALAHHLFEIRGGPAHPQARETVGALAAVLSASGAYRDAEAHWQRALNVARNTYPSDHPALTGPLVGLGQVLLDRGADADGRALLREALEIRRVNYPKDDPRIIEVTHLLDGS